VALSGCKAESLSGSLGSAATSAPTFQLAGGATTSASLPLSIEISTGPALENCLNFTGMALSESNTVVPAIFPITCTTTGTQTEAYVH
jgi:hypothetical protein